MMKQPLLRQFQALLVRLSWQRLKIKSRLKKPRLIGLKNLSARYCKIGKYRLLICTSSTFRLALAISTDQHPEWLISPCLITTARGAQIELSQFNVESNRQIYSSGHLPTTQIFPVHVPAQKCALSEGEAVLLPRQSSRSSPCKFEKNSSHLLYRHVGHYIPLNSQFTISRKGSFRSSY